MKVFVLALVCALARGSSGSVVGWNGEHLDLSAPVAKNAVAFSSSQYINTIPSSHVNSFGFHLQPQLTSPQLGSISTLQSQYYPLSDSSYYPSFGSGSYYPTIDTGNYLQPIGSGSYFPPSFPSGSYYPTTFPFGTVPSQLYPTAPISPISPISPIGNPISPIGNPISPISPISPINPIYPGQYPGQLPGQYPGQLPGQYPGQLPGQYPDQPVQDFTTENPASDDDTQVVDSAEFSSGQAQDSTQSQDSDSSLSRTPGQKSPCPENLAPQLSQQPAPGFLRFSQLSPNFTFRQSSLNIPSDPSTTTPAPNTSGKSTYSENKDQVKRKTA